MRRFSESRGGGSRQDVLNTEGADGPFGSDKDQEARVTYKIEKKQVAGQKREDGAPESGVDRARGDGRP